MKVMNDWILVRVDPPNLQRGSIVLVEEGKVRTAIVMQTGPGKLLSSGERRPTDVKEGEKVAFLRWNQEHGQGKQLANVLKELGNGAALIKADDVLFTWSANETHLVE